MIEPDVFATGLVGWAALIAFLLLLAAMVLAFVRIAIGPIPAAMLCIGILFAFKYPLTREQYAQVTQQLESQRAKQVQETI